MNAHIQDHRDYTFAIGLLTGACVGAGLALWLTPRAGGELRRRIADSADELGQRAVDQYQQASARVGNAVDDLTRTGQGVRDRVADAVVRGANEVGRFAAASKTDRVL